MDCEDVIKIILTPPKAYCPAEDQWLIPLNMAFIIDEIWYLRNQVLNHCAEINIEESFKRVKHKLNEHSVLFTKEDASLNLAPPPAKWEAPPHLWIKLNVDAALSDSSSALVVVARDSMGDIIKIWSKTIPSALQL